MSILINENLLRLRYLQETGNERPTHEFSKDYSTYVEWLEEKLSMVFQEKHTTRLSNSTTPILKVEETK
jgi:hypothetical protein